MKKICISIAVLVCFHAPALSQQVPVFTADSIESGNAKDIFINFFQLAFNNLTGSNREFNFSASPYAIMLKKNPQLSIDKMYSKYRPLRKLNISFGVRADSSFYFNGFSSGIKYALIDKTDITASNEFVKIAAGDPLHKERIILRNLFRKYLQETPLPDSVKDEFKKLFTKLGTVLFDTISNTGFKTAIKKIVDESGLTEIKDVFENKKGKSFKDIEVEKFNEIKNAMKKNLLWTIGISDTTYKDKFQFANVSITTEISKGLFNPKKGQNNLEFNGKAALNFLNDSLREGRNLHRQIFTAEAGFNWVIRDQETDDPFFETKFSSTYYRNLAGLYQGEKRDSLTLNGTLRFRLSDDIWIPLEVKYDPKTGNVFGFLNVRANFTGFRNLLKKKVTE